MSGHCLFVMARLQILLLIAVPLCAAQFRIQGPSDGNRQSQGLQFDREKGIQYDDQRASLGTGDFSIQGASDGNNDFKIQGASDGNSDFQIYGATDGQAEYHIRGPTDANAQYQIQGASDGNANFVIQGATDGHSQSSVQGPYDANQQSGHQLQYRDPSGLNVNWKTYQPSGRPQPQVEHQQYVAAAPAPIPRRRKVKQHYVQADAHIPAATTATAPQTAAAPGINPYYKVYDKTPPQIQQILQFQQAIPYMNIIPEQFRFNFNSALQIPIEQGNVQPQVRQHGRQQYHQPILQQAEQAEPQEAAPVLPEQPQPRAPQRGRARGYSRQKREAQHRQRQSQRAHQAAQPAAEAPAQPQAQYGGNVPSRIQDLIKFQAQIPYINHIPEQFRYETLLAREEVKPQSQFQHQPLPEPVRHSQRVRQRRQAPHQQQHQQQDQVDLSKYQRISQPPPEPQPHYSTNLPANLQQLLKFQSQTPYTSVIPEQFRYEKLNNGHGNSRRKRQAPQYQQQQQQPDLSQYQRISQPQAEPTPQYSTNLPSSLQQLLQFQAQVPYDIIANRIQIRLDKPYVPQSVPAAPIRPYQQPQQAQPQPQPQYQQAYQPQAQSQYQQPQLINPSYQQQEQQQQSYQQSQLIRPQYHPNAISPNSPYNSGQNVRPVTENQY